MLWYALGDHGNLTPCRRTPQGEKALCMLCSRAVLWLELRVWIFPSQTSAILYRLIRSDPIWSLTATHGISCWLRRCRAALMLLYRGRDRIVPFSRTEVGGHAFFYLFIFLAELIGYASSTNFSKRISTEAMALPATPCLLRLSGGEASARSCYNTSDNRNWLVSTWMLLDVTDYFHIIARPRCVSFFFSPFLSYIIRYL